MVVLKFEDIKFQKEKDFVRGIFLQNFYFIIKNNELEKLGKFKVKDGNLEIEGKEEIVKRNFNNLLDRKLRELRNFLGKKVIYIYKGFLPLIGSLYFGIIDRNTNIIEIRPITGCNLNCIFCSVDLSKRERDFVVSADYFIEEIKKLAELKRTKTNNLEIHINAMGEPLLYSPLAYLIKGLKRIKGVKTISIDTNGSLLTERKVDELVKAGLTRFNISMNAFSEETATKIAGAIYPFQHVKKMCKYIAKKCDILLAPVWMQGVNDKDIEEIIKFSQELKKIRTIQKVPFIGIQNFLEYKYGKIPTKAISFEEFYKKLEILEKKYNLKLKLSREDFGIKVANVLKKPFEKGDYVQALVVCDGKFKNEKLCSSHDRIISVKTFAKPGKKINCRITRTKYNIFYGKEI
ncbi:MAG: radical SAM protein [Candidatus Pacearchaeota archaeon]